MHRKILLNDPNASETRNNINFGCTEAIKPYTNTKDSIQVLNFYLFVCFYDMHMLYSGPKLTFIFGDYTVDLDINSNLIRIL